MLSRERLHAILKEIIGNDNVYYQPPESIRMKYPAIVYSRNSIDNQFADNIVYKQDYSYRIIVIDTNPDSEIVNKISQLPMCRFDRHFVSDNLYHDIFTLYF